MGTLLILKYIFTYITEFNLYAVILSKASNRKTWENLKELNNFDTIIFTHFFKLILLSRLDKNQES